jgi:mediator of RNA polymerase II transcription subunit 13, fungi type
MFSQDGSSDIAYAVCILAKKGDSGVPAAERTDSESSPRSGIERLRSAETELRNAGILVSLDISGRDLFTFYRKEDLQKDAKSILNRVVTILRKNACQMSSKSATKAADLLRSDRARLYRQFMRAVLSMMKSVFEQDENLVTLDLNTFLFRNPSLFNQNDGFKPELDSPWRLLDLKAQLLPNGQIIALYRHDPLQLFKSVSSVYERERIDSFLRKPTKVLLALAGQYARYTGGYLGKLPSSLDATTPGSDSADRGEEVMLERYRQQIWKISVQQWLCESELVVDFDIDEEVWIEVELPLCEVDREHPISTDGFAQLGEIMWKSIFWPTSLCFVSSTDQPEKKDVELSHDFEDPLMFVEDWVASAADREAALAKTEQDVNVRLKPDRAEDRNLSQNSNVHPDASQCFQRVASLDGQAMTTVYPTPPDGALSQVTPGVLSVDGLIATPGERAVPGEADRTASNAEVFNAIGNQATIGTGFYDEDLFEDVPGQKFDVAEMADEPNWDFFDEPDADTVQDTGRLELDESEKGGNIRADHSYSSENPNDDFENNSSKSNGGVGSHQPDKAHESDSITHTEDDLLSIPRDAAKGPERVETRQTGRMSAPLSPIEIRKKLFPHAAGQDPNHVRQNNAIRHQRRSLLETTSHPNDHQPDLKVADTRYYANGLFWFDTKDGMAIKTDLTEHHLGVPRVGIPKKERSATVSKSVTAFDSPVSPPLAESTDFDSDDLFSESHQLGSLNKLKEDGADSIAALPGPVDNRLDPEAENGIREEVLDLLELLRPEINEHSFSRLHQLLQRHANPSLPISRHGLLTVAQVMVDQVSQSLFYDDAPGIPSTRSQAVQIDISGQLHSIYGDTTEPDLTQLLAISASPEDIAEGNIVMDVPSPSIRLARGDATVDALPTIQPFWETLGLQPLSGKKSVKAICIHPVGTHIEEGCTSFLQRLSEIYLNCNLGIHGTINIEGLTGNGLIEWDMGMNCQMSKLCDVCERLGLSLATLPVSAENIIVYIVNPFEDRSALADICAAFVALFTNFSKACGKVKQQELNLQVVPMSFIASPDAVVFPSQAEYLNLGLEVYNRCPLTNSSGTAADSGAAVMLAEHATNKIMFSLTSDAVSPFFKDREMLHLAYSQSLDFRWIVACWTDKVGKVALTMTYCLSQKGSSVSRPRSEVIKEMWEISADIMISARGKWRLSVAHDGPVEPEEINEWLFLANESASNGSAQCTLTLLTFDEYPSIQFSPPAPLSKRQPPPTAAAAAAYGKYGTPASTPSAAAMASSPEQLTASTPFPPTPGASNPLAAPTPPEQGSQSQAHGFDVTTDPDATLVNPIDDCWSVILPFGLNNSHSSLNSRPALQSGFLLKRRGHSDSDGLVELGVNLILTCSNPTKAEQNILLREILGQWRGLYTLARTKGLGGPDSVLPWHVRTAIKGCKAVSGVL